MTEYRWEGILPPTFFLFLIFYIISTLVQTSENLEIVLELQASLERSFNAQKISG